MVKKLTVIVLALILGMGSIISFTSRVSALDAGKIWLNDDTLSHMQQLMMQ